MKTTITICDACKARLKYDIGNKAADYFEVRHIGTHYAGEQYIWHYCSACWLRMTQAPEGGD